MNNNIVRGFDDERDDSLKIRLQKIEDTEGCLALFLTGYIDTYNSTTFTKRVVKAVEAGFIRLIFDLGRVSYVSSTAIGAFTLFLKTIKPRGGDIVMLDIQPRVYDVFQLLGFSQYFNVRESLEEAVSVFADKGGEGNTGVFPRTFACPVCTRRLKAARAGRFRCSECKTILVLTESGAVELG
jgi:anti-sigma B factor antagonist